MSLAQRIVVYGGVGALVLSALLLYDVLLLVFARDVPGYWNYVVFGPALVPIVAWFVSRRVRRNDAPASRAALGAYVLAVIVAHLIAARVAGVPRDEIQPFELGLPGQREVVESYRAQQRRAAEQRDDVGAPD